MLITTWAILFQVVLVIGISGGCRKQDLRNIRLEHVKDTGSSLIIHLTNSKTFVVPDIFYPFCKKYMNMRPSGEEAKYLPFFINYRNGKCKNEGVGINKFGSVPKQIAEYLGLRNPELYTAHCFRKSSPNLLVDTGSDLLELLRRKDHWWLQTS